MRSRKQTNTLPSPPAGRGSGHRTDLEAHYIGHRRQLVEAIEAAQTSLHSVFSHASHLVVACRDTIDRLEETADSACASGTSPSISLSSSSSSSASAVARLGAARSSTTTPAAIPYHLPITGLLLPVDAVLAQASREMRRDFPAACRPLLSRMQRMWRKPDVVLEICSLELILPLLSLRVTEETLTQAGVAASLREADTPSSTAGITYLTRIRRAVDNAVATTSYLLLCYAMELASPWNKHYRNVQAQQQLQAPQDATEDGGPPHSRPPSASFTSSLGNELAKTPQGAIQLLATPTHTRSESSAEAVANAHHRGAPTRTSNVSFNSEMAAAAQLLPGVVEGVRRVISECRRLASSCVNALHCFDCILTHLLEVVRCQQPRHGSWTPGNGSSSSSSNSSAIGGSAFRRHMLGSRRVDPMNRSPPSPLLVAGPQRPHAPGRLNDIEEEAAAAALLTQRIESLRNVAVDFQRDLNRRHEECEARVCRPLEAFYRAAAHTAGDKDRVHSHSPSGSSTGASHASSSGALDLFKSWASPFSRLRRHSKRTAAVSAPPPLSRPAATGPSPHPLPRCQPPSPQLPHLTAYPQPNDPLGRSLQRSASVSAGSGAGELTLSTPRDESTISAQTPPAHKSSPSRQRARGRRRRGEGTTQQPAAASDRHLSVQPSASGTAALQLDDVLKRAKSGSYSVSVVDLRDGDGPTAMAPEAGDRLTHSTASAPLVSGSGSLYQRRRPSTPAFTACRSSEEEEPFTIRRPRGVSSDPLGRQARGSPSEAPASCEFPHDALSLFDRLFGGCVQALADKLLIEAGPQRHSTLAARRAAKALET